MIHVMKNREVKRKGDSSQGTGSVEELGEETERTPSQLFDECTPLLASRHPAKIEQARGVIDKILQALGLDPSAYQKWADLSIKAGSVDDPSLKMAKAILEFMPVVIKLESQRPGLVKYFADNFGLVCFGRTVTDSRYFTEWYDALSRTDAQQGESERQKWVRLVSESLSAVGLSNQIIEQLFTTWKHCSRDSNPFTSVSKNTAALLKLYSIAQYKTTVPTLVEEFGIHNFCRYDPQVLINQFEHKNAPGDFGLLVFPKTDWNEAFDQNSGVISQLATKSTQLGINLRIVEAGRVNELLARTGKMVRKSGSKIMYLVLGGHGSLDDIRLGGDPHFGETDGRRRVVTTQDVLRPETRLFRRWFADNPQIVLVSCSTGGDGGIAEKISAQLNARVTAPVKPSNVNTIQLFRTGGDRGDGGNDLDLWVVYTRSQSAKFNAGARIRDDGWFEIRLV